MPQLFADRLSNNGARGGQSPAWVGMIFGMASDGRSRTYVRARVCVCVWGGDLHTHDICAFKSHKPVPLCKLRPASICIITET